MVYEISKSKWSIYVVLLLLILGANYTLYHFPVFYPLNDKIVIASLIDFILVIPILTYFLIIRKKFSLKTIGIPLLGGYAAAYYIIPQDLLQSFSQLTWFIIVIESFILCIEIFLLYKMATKFPKLIHGFRNRSKEGYYFIENINETLRFISPNALMAKIWTTEISIYFYSLFSYRKKINISSSRELFTYHKKTGVIALNIMLIHAIVVETIGLHYMFHKMNRVLSYIMFFLNVYTVLFFLAEIQAIRLTPIQIRNEEIVIQIGIMKRINVPLKNILKFDYYNGPEKISSKESKTIFDARVNDFFQRKPTFEIHLSEPSKASLLYGFTKNVDRIVISVDEPERFYQTINKYMIENQSN